MERSEEEVERNGNGTFVVILNADACIREYKQTKSEQNGMERNGDDDDDDNDGRINTIHNTIL